MDDELLRQQLARLMAGEKSEPTGNLSGPQYEHPIDPAWVDSNQEVFGTPDGNLSKAPMPRSALREFVSPSEDDSPGMLEQADQGLGKILQRMSTHNIYGEDVEQKMRQKQKAFQEASRFQRLKDKMSGQ